ncbi:UDP-3-O-(3-hydroxymyristoyl)glucosamine N-acyltransferase [soil metagenome]
MITVAALAEALDAELAGDGDLEITGVAEPEAAGTGELALAMAPLYRGALGRCRARAAVLWSGADWQALGLEAALYVRRPRYALAGLTRVFERPVETGDGIHPTAVIDPSAEIAVDASIGPFVVIGARVRLGPGVRVLAHVSIAEDAAIGAGALLHPGVRIGARVAIGARFVAQPGAVVGGDGFSFVTPTPGLVEAARARGVIEAIDQAGYARINSLGAVRIGEDVELGANACIDRGTVADTVIGDGTKIDNLVQIGHNVRIGRTCLVCGMAAIGGSTVIGDRVVIGGAASIADNLRIGSNTVITGRAGVASHVAANRIMMGYPAVRMAESVAMYKALRRLPRLLAQGGGPRPAADPGASDPDGDDPASG